MTVRFHRSLGSKEPTEKWFEILRNPSEKKWVLIDEMFFYSEKMKLLIDKGIGGEFGGEFRGEILKNILDLYPRAKPGVPPQIRQSFFK